MLKVHLPENVANRFLDASKLCGSSELDRHRPLCPTADLSDMLKEFNIVETSQVSYSYISQIRDAFAEIIKGMNCKQITQTVATSLPKAYHKADQESVPVFIKHVHDEASMKVRSYNDDGLEWSND